MLRSRPDVAKRWSPYEVARRYLTIMRIAKCMSDDLPLPDEKRIEQAVRNKKRIQQMRRRLSNISWFMGILCENIAAVPIRKMNAQAGFSRPASSAVNVPIPTAC